MITFNDWHKGIAQSKNINQGFDNLVNADVHTSLGELQCNLALTSESTTPNEPCIRAEDPSGNVYWLSTTTGKIWLRTAAGSYSLVATNANGTNLGAEWHNNRLVFATASKLGFFGDAITMTIATPCVVTMTAHGLAADTPISFSTTGALPTGIVAGTTYYVKSPAANTFNVSATPGGAAINTTGTQSGVHSIWVHSWKTFTNGAAYKPMAKVNLSLFIGDGKYVASVDNANTFSANVLDILPEDTITALIATSYDLLIGTFIGANVKKCRVYLWDTYSPSWTSEDIVPDNGVNCFIDGDGVIYAQIGSTGWIYYWTGAQMKRFFKLRGITTTQGDQCSTVHNGRPLYAIGTKVFSIHRESESLPFAVVQEYTATTGTIKSIISTGIQLLLSNGSNIDKLGTNYAVVTIDSIEFQGKMNDIKVKYFSIGSGGTVDIANNIDNAGYVDTDTVVDEINKTVYFDGGLPDCNFGQTRITLTPSGANNIVIKDIVITE